MKKIYLGRKKLYFTLVDDEDYEWLSQWRWNPRKIHKSKIIYAARNEGPVGASKVIHLHRVIMNTPKGMDTDHINGNTLDNRRSNLRVCTHQENRMNTKTPITNTSGIKGVTWDKNRGKWQSQIHRAGKFYFLGRYDTLQEAYVARVKAAIDIHGEFARL